MFNFDFKKIMRAAIKAPLRDLYFGSVSQKHGGAAICQIGDARIPIWSRSASFARS
ncbi:hypothetical protein [Rhodoblastus sp.]|uniref:hypothetical protein n=1 Tax=Rhodoblastus sp. TaxID=1962975 RepID=UPI003F99F64B